MAHYCVGNAAQQQRLQGGGSMRAEYDHFDVRLGRHVQNRLPDVRVAALVAGLDREAEFARELVPSWPIVCARSSARRSSSTIARPLRAITVPNGGQGENFKRRTPYVQ